MQSIESKTSAPFDHSWPKLAWTSVTQGDAPRLRRSALPWADLLGPLRGEAVVENQRCQVSLIWSVDCIKDT